MKSYAGLLKRSYVAKIGVLVICIVIIYFFIGVEVKAQYQPPCVDSTPFCPCLLENGDCFDIDTPIDSEVFILVIAAISLGLYKLHLKRVS